MNGWFAKVGHSNLLAPADEPSSKLVAGLGEGEGLVMSVKKVRSIYWHNMYFAICQHIGELQDPVRSKDSIDAELRVYAGHFDVMPGDGFEIRVPRRIAFDKLSAQEWSVLWKSLDLAMQERFHFDFEAWKRHAA